MTTFPYPVEAITSMWIFFQALELFTHRWILPKFNVD